MFLSKHLISTTLSIYLSIEIFCGRPNQSFIARGRAIINKNQWKYSIKQKKQSEIVAEIAEKTFKKAIRNLQEFMENSVKIHPKSTKNGKKSWQTLKNNQNTH